jgi:hypothetical protein
MSSGKHFISDDAKFTTNINLTIPDLLATGIDRRWDFKVANQIMNQQST